MNLPNKITIFRICLIPLFVFIYLFPFTEYGVSLGTITILKHEISLRYVYCLAIFGIASITDFIDGWIARKFNLVTSFGKFLDPIADKLLVNTAFILLAYERIVPVVLVIIMIARDTIVDAMRMMSADKGVVVAASMAGKTKTVLQMVAIIMSFLHPLEISVFGVFLHDILIYLATAISVYSGYEYFWQMKKYIMESK